MKKKLFAVMVAALFVGACGGGGGGGNPEATLLGPDGTAKTTFDVADPIAAVITGMTADTQYTVQVSSPSGVVCSSSVWAGADGTIPASPYCFLQDMDTARFGADGRVDTALVKSGLWADEFGEPEIDGPFLLGKAVETGDYVLEVIDSAGDVIITKSVDDMDIAPLNKAFPVTSTAARTCASNSVGLCGRSFLKTTSNVYVTIEEGSGVAEGAVVDIYLVGDRCSIGWADGTTPLQAVMGSSLLGVTVNYTGGLFTTAAPVWANPSTTGTFDVVVDVDRNAVYSAGDLVEILDQTDPGGLCAPGFTVQDAFSTGTDVIMQIAMNANRAYQDVFSIADNEDIYAQVQSQRRLVHKFGVKKYVVVHQDTWTDGDPLVDVIPATLDVVQTGCTNQQRRLIAPINLMSAGCYDVVFDVDGDGVYDKGGDAVDNIDLNGANTCGFMVAGGDGSLTINAITNNEGVDVKNGTSDSLTSKVTITGTVDGFSDGSQVTAYSVVGAQQGGAISTTVVSGAFTITDMPLLAGAGLVKVFVREGTKVAVGLATVTWNPGGVAGIDIYATITWLTLTDMDTHFLKTGGVYTGRSETTNYQDCHYTNCTQDSDQALLWTTAAGSQTTSADTNDAVARLDLDCIGCPAKTENVWIKGTSGVVDKVGNFLLCVVAFSGTDTPSAAVSINGVQQAQVTAPAAISSSSGNDMWFVGYASQDASGNLQWSTVNAVGVGAAVCAQP